MKLRKLFTALALAVGFTTAATATPRTISINFGSGSGSVSGEYGIVPSSSWNNFADAKSNGAKAVTVSDGTTGVTAQWWSKNTWNYTSGVTDNALKGYLDDGACGDGQTSDGPHICVQGIPFEHYDVIIYHATDTGNAQFNPAALKEWTVQTECGSQAYSYDGSKMAARNDASLKFGQSQQATAIYGKNVSYLRKAFTWTNLDIKGGKNANSARGCIAAIQIVEVEPVEYSVEINEDMTWTEIKEQALEVTGEFPENAQITLKIEDGAENPTITFDTTETLKGGLAFFKIVGTCQIAYPEGLYEDGCWSKTLFSAALIEATDATGVLKTGYKGGWTLGPTEIALRAQNREVISINIGGGKNTAETSEAANLVSGSDYYGLYPVPGDSWNNISGRWQSGPKTVTLSSAKSFDGATTEVRSSIKLSGTSKNTWQCDAITNPFLRGYLDDGGDGISVEVTGVPYTKYDVIVYVTSDDAQYKLRPLQINGTWYTYNVDGDLVVSEGEHGYDGAEWGAGAVQTPAIGQNAMLITDVVGSTLTVHGYRPNSSGARATVCAVQLISRGELASKDFTANIIDSTTWDDGEGAGLAGQSGTWESGELNTITLTNTADEATFTLNGEITAASLKIVCQEGKTLYVEKDENATLNIGGYNLMEAFGDVIFNFDPDLSKVDAGSCLVGIGYDYEGTIQSGFKYLGSNNALTMATINSGRVVIGGTGTLKGDLDVFGGAEVTVGGDYTSPDDDVKLAVSKGTLTIAEGADIQVSNICLVNSGDNSNDGDLFINGKLTVTSECGSTVYGSHGNHKGILFGHYYGRSDVTVGATGQLIAENSWIQMTYTAASSLTIDGGTVKVLGLNIGSKENTPVVVQNGGTLALKEGLMQQNRGVYTFNGGTLGAWGDYAWTPTTTAFANDCVIDAAGNTLTLSGAVTGSGTLTIRNGVVKLTGDLSGYTGAIAVADDATLDLGTNRPTNTFTFNGATEVRYTENIVDDGVVYQLTLSGGETPTYKVFDADGNEKTVTGGKYAPSVAGKVALYAWEFNGTLASVGQKTDAMGKDHGPYYNDANDAVYAYSQPYMGFTWPAEFTTMIACTLPTNANVCLVGFGQASPGGIALTSGDVTKNEVKLVYWQNNQPYTVLTTMKVPNAYDYEHLYLVTKTADSVKVYLDGTLVASYSGALSLGLGIQVGTVFQGVGATGLIRLDNVYSGTNDCKSVVNAIRVYDTILGPNAVAALKEEFKYISPNGSFSRTLPSEAEAFWMADGQWVNDATQETASKPDAESAVNLTGVTSTSVKINLAEDTTYESLTLNGDADSVLTIQASGFESFPGKIRADGLVTVNAPVILDYAAIDIAGVPLTVTENGAITFNLLKFPFDTYYAGAYVPLTGVSEKYEDQMFAALPQETPGRTMTFGYDEATQTYGITITVEDYPFVYNEGWTWNEQPVAANAVSNNTASAIVVQSDLEWAIDRSTFTVEDGTLKVTAVTKRAAEVTVDEGAVLDLNGNNAKEMALTLNGGKVTNSGALPAEADQIKVLALTADSEIETPVKGQVYAASYGTATTIALDTYTLTKTGADVLQVVNTDITGTGTVDIREGEFYGSEDTRAAGVTFRVAEGATLHNRDGKTMTLAKIVGAGGTLLNKGTISAFTLSGELTLANSGAYGTITNAAGAVATIGQRRNLVFAGAGTVNATLTDAEFNKTGDRAIFTLADGATTGLRVFYGDKDITGKCTISGGTITAIDHEAKIGTTYYLTLADALTNATDGATITVLKDLTVAERINLAADKDITLDVNGKTISVTQALYPIVWGNEGTAKTGKLTITGDGTFQQDSDPAGGWSPMILWAKKGTIEVLSGTFNVTKGTAQIGYVNTVDGKLLVKGGTWTIVDKAQGVKGDVFNVAQTLGLTKSDYIQCSGGSFSKDPAEGDDALGPTFVAEGYYSVPVAGDRWAVVDATDLVAAVGDHGFATLDAALAAAKDGDTVKLLADIETDATEAFAINKDITLDFGDYTVTKTVANDYTFDIANGATVVFEGGEGGVTQTQTAKNPDWPASMIRNKGNLTIKGGVYTSDFCIIKNDEAPGAGVLTVDGGTFNIVAAAEGMDDVQMALMNWATATINGGTWNGGVIASRSCDGNAVSKFGVTEITAELEGNVDYMLMVGYPGDTTYAYVPKMKGIAQATIKLTKVPTITDELELFTDDDDYVTVQKKQSAPTPAPGSDVKVDPLPGKENTYVVTPTGESKDVVIENVADGATLIVNGKSVDSLVVDNKTGVNVVVSNRTDTVDVTKAVVGWGTPLATSGLQLKTASAGYTWSNAIAVRPVIDSFSFGDSGEAVIGVTNTVNGLFYTLMRREELDYTPTAVTEEEMATGDTMTQTDDEPLEGQAFYEVKGAL